MIDSQVKINLAFEKKKKIRAGDSGFSNTSSVDARHNPKVQSACLIVGALRLLYLIHPREEHKGCVVSMPDVKKNTCTKCARRGEAQK